MNEVGVVKTTLKDILFSIRKLCECDMAYFTSKLSRKDLDAVNEVRKKEKEKTKEELWYPLTRYFLAKLLFQV